MKPALDPAVTRIVGRAARRLRLDRALRMAVRAAVWMLIALVAAPGRRSGPARDAGPSRAAGHPARGRPAGAVREDAAGPRAGRPIAPDQAEGTAAPRSRREVAAGAR